MTASFQIHAIGRINKTEHTICLEVSESYQEGLLGLDQFSHILVFTWFHRNDSPENRRILRVHPRGNRSNPLTGVFATRSPVRPNLIGICTCRLLSVDGCTLRIDQIDALDNTPVIDIKPWISERPPVSDVKVPQWVRKGS
jgi:tRNA-Thr(GGU) m(6)t(6)A37 methyltransferase TsaA